MTARRRVFSLSPCRSLRRPFSVLSHSSPGRRRRRGRRRADGEYPPRTSSSRSLGG